jgi:hypothetical protein
MSYAARYKINPAVLLFGTFIPVTHEKEFYNYCIVLVLSAGLVPGPAFGR